jgi:quinol-cytochrome oxidoreductase complex cytochrome b subunit
MKAGIRSWFDSRFGLSSLTKFLEEKTVPQHKHTILYYTGSAILLFLAIQVITGLALLAIFCLGTTFLSLPLK